MADLVDYNERQFFKSSSVKRWNNNNRRNGLGKMVRRPSRGEGIRKTNVSSVFNKSFESRIRESTYFLSSAFRVSEGYPPLYFTLLLFSFDETGPPTSLWTFLVGVVVDDCTKRGAAPTRRCAVDGTLFIPYSFARFFSAPSAF